MSENQDQQQQQQAPSEASSSPATSDAPSDVPPSTNQTQPPEESTTPEQSTAQPSDNSGGLPSAPTVGESEAAPDGASTAIAGPSEASAATVASDAVSEHPSKSGAKSATGVAPVGSSKSTTGAAKSTTGAPKSTTGHQHQSTTKSNVDEKERKRSPSVASGRSTHGKRKRIKLGELDLSTAKIGFLGAGKMAESTINGLIHYGEYLLETLEALFGCSMMQPTKLVLQQN